jgi:hypothetical protein
VRDASACEDIITTAAARSGRSTAARPRIAEARSAPDLTAGTDEDHRSQRGGQTAESARRCRSRRAGRDRTSRDRSGSASLDGQAAVRRQRCWSIEASGWPGRRGALLSGSRCLLPDAPMASGSRDADALDRWLERACSWREGGSPTARRVPARPRAGATLTHGDGEFGRRVDCRSVLPSSSRRTVLLVDHANRLTG